MYYSVISHLDEQIGLILAALERSGQLENTVVIFSSDHGLAMGSHGLRGKQNMYEHSVGVPLIFRGPGIEAGHRSDAQCYLRDLYPTACEMCDVEVPASVQGRSLLPVLQNTAEQVYDEVFAHFRDSQRMIRTREWKYVAYPLTGHQQLFRLADDPHELRNLAYDPEYSETVRDLRARLTAWRQKYEASPSSEDRVH